MAKDLIGNYNERTKDLGTVKEGKDTWSANQIETEAVRIEDPGQGEAVVLRHFFFKAKPAPTKPTKQQLFSEYKMLIETTLWGDGLEPIPEAKVEVHTSNGAKKVSRALYKKMREVKADFVILVLCRARKGVMINERPLIAT